MNHNITLGIMRACAGRKTTTWNGIMRFQERATSCEAVATVLEALQSAGIVAAVVGNDGVTRYGLAGWFVDEVRSAAWGLADLY